MKLDPWQEELIVCEEPSCIHSGRQTGKSFAVGKKIARIARKYPNKTTLVIAPTERQAFALFQKSMSEFSEKELKKGKDKPTMHRYVLKSNNHEVICHPTGLAGTGIRYLTVFHLVSDETPYIAEEVWTAVMPMMATTKGIITFLGTPFGDEGFYYNCFMNDKFKKFHLSSEDCPRIPKEFLQQEKKRMTAAQYAQEYLGQFIENLTQLFPDSLIQSCMTAKGGLSPSSSLSSLYLGVDVAGMGADPTAMIGLIKHGESIEQEYQDQYNHERTTFTVDRILLLDIQKDYTKIGVDGGGLGAGVVDPLLRNDRTKRKVEDLNNSKKTISSDGREKVLLKEDMYANLKVIMETRKISLWENDDLFSSLKSVQVEQTEDKKIKIYGNNTHLAEALIRAAWLANRKHNKLWIL